MHRRLVLLIFAFFILISNPLLVATPSVRMTVVASRGGVGVVPDFPVSAIRVALRVAVQQAVECRCTARGVALGTRDIVVASQWKAVMLEAGGRPCIDGVALLAILRESKTLVVRCVEVFRFMARVAVRGKPNENTVFMAVGAA